MAAKENNISHRIGLVEVSEEIESRDEKQLIVGGFQGKRRLTSTQFQTQIEIPPKS